MLHAGINVIAVALEDHGRVTAFDMHVTAAIPEPGTYALLLAGLGMLGFLARRYMNRKRIAGVRRTARFDGPFLHPRALLT